MRTLLLIVGVLVGFAAGLGTGVLTTRDGAAVPAEVHGACATFMDAYDEALADANEMTDAQDPSELAHPWRVSDVWAPLHTVALTDAVETVRWEEHAEDGDDEWWGVRRALNEALLMMGDPMTSAVEKEQSLSAAQAVCVGR